MDKQIESSDWLTKGKSKEELAEMKAKAIEEAEKELREKQIEEHIATIEIKKELCDKPCDLCKMYGKECMPERMAKKLAKQGYRKQVQGKWLEVRTVRYNGTKPYTQIAHQCSNCKWLNKHSKGWNTNYCPNCSAKMKGAEW